MFTSVTWLKSFFFFKFPDVEVHAYMFVVKEVRKVVKSKNHIKKKTNQLTEVLLFA